MKKCLKATLLFALVLAAFVSCKKKSSASGSFYVGASGPLSGGAAVYGVAVKNGAELALAEINAAGGLDGDVSTTGDNFRFNMFDDAHNPDKVPAGYAQLQEEGMQVSLGCVTTKPCLVYKTLSHEDGLFFITPSATGDTVPEFDEGHQVCFSDSSQGMAAAEFVKKNISKSTKIGVFYKTDDDYSKGNYDNFMKVMNGTGFDLTIASFDNDTATDFSAQVNKLKDCMFLFMPIYYEPAASFMKAAKGIVSDRAEYFGCDGFDGIEGKDGLGDEFNAIRQKISYISHFNSNATSGAEGDFIRKYSEKYGEKPIQFAAGAYDCMFAIRDAMRFAVKNGKKIDASISAKDLGAILKDVFNDPAFSFSGVTGTNMKWFKTGEVDPATKNITDYVIKDFS